MWKGNSRPFLSPRSFPLHTPPVSVAPIADGLGCLTASFLQTRCFFIPMIGSCPPLEYGAALMGSKESGRSVTRQSDQKSEVAQRVS